MAITLQVYVMASVKEELKKMEHAPIFLPKIFKAVAQMACIVKLDQLVLRFFVKERVKNPLHLPLPLHLRQSLDYLPARFLAAMVNVSVLVPLLDRFPLTLLSLFQKFLPVYSQ